MGLARKHKANMIFLEQLLEARQDTVGYLK